MIRYLELNAGQLSELHISSLKLSMDIVRHDVERCLDLVAYVQREGAHRRVRDVLYLSRLVMPVNSP